MPITIRKAIKEDMKAVHVLIEELALYENALEEVVTTVETFEQDGFSKDSWFQVYVAEEKSTGESKELPKIVGCALFYLAYSTWKGKMVYLEDLVVTKSHRRLGIGRLLLDAVFDFARTKQARQVRWHVLDWNEPAIEFYKQLNVELDAEWLSCRYEL